MALSKELKNYLDSLDDELFISWLAIHFGHNEPVWKECTQEEYEKYCGKIELKSDSVKWTSEMLEDVCRKLFSSNQYKAEPIYHNIQSGLFWQIKNFNRKPDKWKYYKRAGSKFVFHLSQSMLDYCSTRDCMKTYLSIDYE